MTTTTPADRRHRNAPTAPADRFVRRWPTALGIAVAVAAAYDLTDGAGLSVTIALPVLVYLAAAALQRPSASWAVFAVALGAVAAMKVLAVEPVLGLAGATAVCLLIGAVRGLLGTGALFKVQSAGALGFGGIAVAALYVDPTTGGFLVSAGLIGHGTWDVIHHRRDIVVARSVSEFCAVLDFILGGVILVFMFATIS